MMFHFKPKFTLLLSGTTLTALVFLVGCGGGGSGGGTPSPTATPTAPSPFDATYNTTFTPTAAIPADGQAPTGSLSISGGKASLQTTFFLQPTVVSAVQAAVNSGLTSAGGARFIRDNQVPATIAFTGTGQLDGNGKLVLTSTRRVDICGSATLTIDPTFTNNGTTSTGTGTYNISFPGTLTIQAAGERTVTGTCNNLPLRTGTVTFAKQ